MKVAIIGLSGADPSLVSDERADELGNLARLAERGVRGTIASTHPPEPVPAWSTFATGQNPGRLGLTGPRNRDWTRTRLGREAPYGEGVEATSHELDAATIWERVNEAGEPVALVGVPATFPVEPVDGVAVSHPPGRPTDEATHPADLADELADELGPPPSDEAEAGLARARSVTDRRFDVAEHLAETRDWELLFLVDEGPRLAHEAAGTEADEALADYHRRLDERVGDLVDALPEDAAVLVVSETGAQPAHGALRINEWLRREGYLALVSEPDRPRPLEPELVDWANTQVWASGGAAGRIHLNVAGREPEGIVDPLDYEALRDELQAALARIEADGETVEARALKPREVHEGERVDEAPDLLCYVEQLAFPCEPTVGHGAVVGEPQTRAAPTREGLFVLADPEDRYGGSVEDLELLDGAATVLDLLGIEAPSEVEGRVLQPDGSLADR